MNKHVIKPAKCGAVDSKYFGNLDQFDKDIEMHKEDVKEYKERVRQLLLENPNKIKKRYHQTIGILMELKKEFNL